MLGYVEFVLHVLLALDLNKLHMNLNLKKAQFKLVQQY